MSMKLLNNIEPAHNIEIDEKFHQMNLFNIRNVIYWYKYFEMIKKVPGDLVECGIGRGRSLLIIAAINQLLNTEDGGNRCIFGYDSFEGFPEPTSEDLSYRSPKKGDWAYSPSKKYKYTPEFIKLVLREAQIEYDENKFVFCKGYFCDTLKNHPNKKIALLHIDGDLYQSYIDALENLYDKVALGGVIIFDDIVAYNLDNDRWPGARKAVKKFFGGHTENLKVNDKGTYYLIKEKENRTW